MSDRTWADTGIAAATDAVASAAEQVRASAPGAYDASKRAASYVGETASEHPVSVLLGTAAVAFIAGYLSNARSGNDTGDGQKRSRDWQKRAYEMSDRVRSEAPRASAAANKASQYVSRNTGESPISGFLGVQQLFAFSATSFEIAADYRNDIATAPRECASFDSWRRRAKLIGGGEATGSSSIG